MGSELLSKLLPDEGDDESKIVPHLSYSDVFENHFPYYLAIGMTVDEYWNGDPSLCKAFRKADEIRRERMNYESWLQGAYVYEALCGASPLFNAMSKRGKPFPYAKKPYEFKKPEKQKTNAEAEREEAKIQKDKFMRQMQMINARFARQAKEGDDNGR